MLKNKIRPSAKLSLRFAQVKSGPSGDIAAVIYLPNGAAGLKGPLHLIQNLENLNL